MKLFVLLGVCTARKARDCDEGGAVWVLPAPKVPGWPCICGLGALVPPVLLLLIYQSEKAAWFSCPAAY